ncbi:MAG: hypothetical protein JNL32_00795 [Candidatus Kapabacteria bacterium]|nr:hypothetical protein [Candidatus Kapabacteria bacterium]
MPTQYHMRPEATQCSIPIFRSNKGLRSHILRLWFVEETVPVLGDGTWYGAFPLRRRIHHINATRLEERTARMQGILTDIRAKSSVAQSPLICMAF